MASNRLLVRESSDGNSHVKTAHTNKEVQALRHMAISRVHSLLCGVAGVSLAVASALSPSSAYAQALPTGGIVMGGQADIGTAGNHLSIQQSTPTAIISWDQFSIGQPNSVHFDNGAGATLNRVRGNVASQIDGSLTATGSLYLVNPAGIAVGTTGRVETGGTFIGSTLDISDEDFAKAARGEAHTFKGSSAATIVNAGRIGSLGGDVALIAQSVENSGDISALKGTAALTAGTEVYVQDRHVDGGRFVVKTGGAGTKVRNTGSIRAVEVELRANGGNVYALAGNRRGVISASGTTLRGGRVYLTAGSGGTVEVTQHIEARRVASDGSVSGGEIRVSAKTVRIDAALDASGRTVFDASFPAGGIEGDTGAISGAGGLVLVEGNDITLERSSLIDVSGTLGGVALVGGDYQGGVNVANNYLSERVETAKNLTVAEGARITADASAGNGGKVVLWSDVQTDFAGEITAKSMSGIGGDAEVSGKALLAFNGDVDLTGSDGTGNLLLDPYNLTIVAGSGGSVTPTSNNSKLGADTLTNLLKTANTTVTTGFDGAQSGDITINAALTWTSANTLTLFAANTITINEAITAQNGGLTLKAKAGTIASPTITTGANGAIDVGVFYLETGAWVQNSAKLPTFAAKDFRIAGGQPVVGNIASAPTVTFMRVMGGTGADATNAYKIADVYGLQGMATVHQNKAYKLITDIDASSTANWYNGAGFSPIGNDNSNEAKNSFIGMFDGQGHTINNLIINRPDQYHIGLFGYVSNATIKNVGIVGGSISGSYAVGGLVGSSMKAAISNSYTAITVKGSRSNIGGLIGRHIDSTTTNSYASGTVTGTGYNDTSIGGLVGYNSNSTIGTSYASGNVASSGSNVGGLVGVNTAAAQINNSYATGNVTTTEYYAGGLVGVVGSYTTISNSYSTGLVTGASYVGGFIGANGDNSTITASYWDKDTSGRTLGVGSGSAAGITGINSKSGSSAYQQATYAGFNFNTTWYMVQGGRDGVTRPFLRMELEELGKTYNSNGNVVANTYTIKNANQLQLIKIHDGAASIGKTYILGNDIDMSVTSSANFAGHWVNNNSYLDAFGKGFAAIGSSSNQFKGTFNGAGHVISNLYINRPTGFGVGLFGFVRGVDISNVGLKNVDITGDSAVGGLVGTHTDSIISSSYVDGGEVRSVGGAGSAGGLLGRSLSAKVVHSYSTVAVSGTGYIGGLIGDVRGGTVDQSYATGNVTSIFHDAGGLIGELSGGTVSNVYAMGNVTSVDGSAGGLVGVMVNEQSTDSRVVNSYATGHVVGSGNIGGLIGYLYTGSIVSSYWDIDKSGLAKGVGKGSQTGATGIYSTTGSPNAYNRSTYAGFNFTNTWYIADGDTRPMLGMEFTEFTKNFDSLGNVVANTYTISNANQLQLLKLHEGDLSKGNTYILANDIDLATAKNQDMKLWQMSAQTSLGTAVYNNFNPIGKNVLTFQGTFLGNNKTINGLSIDRKTTDYVGLFGYVSSGSVSSLNLTNINIKGNNYTAGLVGYNTSVIYDVNVSGNVTGYGNYVGGLVGYSSGAIGKATSSVTLTASGNAGYVGGLAGYSKGSIQESHAAGSVTSGTGDYTGGFIGYNAGSIVLSDATGVVDTSGNYVGGFTGYNKSTIRNSEARNPIVTGGSTVGGFAGHNDGMLELVFANARVGGTDILGGLVGYNKGTVVKTYATGDVISIGNTVGGLIGANYGQLRLSYATGFVSGTNAVGGLVGLNFNSITDSYSTGNVVATVDRVGGLIGVLAGGSVARTYTKGSVTLASGNIRIGGLVGFYENGTISSSMWNADANKDADQAKQGVGATTGKSTRGVIALTDADFKSTASFMSKASDWNFNTVWAPPGDGYSPELYALSNVIRVHSLVGLNGVTYGDTTVSIDNSILSVISKIYGSGAYTGGAGINTMAAYNSSAALFNFGTQANAAIEQLNTGKYTLSIGGTGKIGTDQGYRIIYTTGVTVAKKAIALDLASQKTYDGKAWTGDGFVPTYDPNSLAFGQTLADLGVLSLSGNGVGAINAGKYSLSVRFDSSGTAKNYDIKYLNPFLTIARAKISAADIDILNDTIAVNKDYDGSDRFTLSSGAIIAGIAGETLSLNLKDGKYDAVNVGNATVTGTWSISKVAGGQKNASNYELDVSSFAKVATITAATIDLSKQTFKVTKTYDGSDIFTVDTRQINTGIRSEALTLSLSNGKFDSPDAGDRTATGTWVISDPTRGSGIASNYIIKGGTEATSANVTIKQAVLDLSKITDLIFNADKVYDGSDIYTLAAINFSTGINGETLTAALDGGKYSSADAGRRIVTGTWNVSDSIGSTSNYQIKGIYARQGAQIDKAKLSQAFIENISSTINADKVYDGSTKFASTSVTDINTGINGETLTLRISDGKYDTVDVGAANVTGKWDIISVAGGQKRAANYELDYTTFSKTANITPAVIDLSRQTFRADKIYDGSDVFTLTDRQIVTGIIGERLTLSLLDGKYSSANAGNVTVGGTWQLSDPTSGKGNAANYIIRAGTENAAVNATVEQATLNLRNIETLKFNANKIYDGSNVYIFAPAIINTGVNGETLNVSLLDGKYSNADAGGRFVTGIWNLANASGLLANYKVTGLDVRQLATISKANLTVTADDVTAAYTGKAWTGGTVGYTGFVNGENEGVLGGQLSWRGSGNLRDIGTYIITPSGLSAKNYQLVYVSGVLTIQ